ncbi:MAG TPA: hypothetical protein VF708_12010 [Pyrinomonadaceae bacterium]|jgi:hypothetical protein
MWIRKILERLRGSTKPSPLEQAQSEFDEAARELVEANRKASAAGHRYTPEMGAAAKRLIAIQQRLMQAKADFDQATGGPEPVELTESVARKVKQLFPPDEQSEAIRLLEKECGRNLPFCENSDVQGLERVRLAVVKLAGGSLAELRRQVDVAKQDWRDVLIPAESPEMVKVGLFNITKLDAETRRNIEVRDRQQYEEWLSGDGESAPPAA